LDSLIHFLQAIILAMRTHQVPELGYGTYLILFLLVAVEGPIAILLASAMASAGLLRPALVFVSAVFGNLTADCVW
jgi:membrane protein DedA with SNARE-associated domain